MIDNADAIQKLATKQHKEFIGGSKFRSEIIEKYQKNHIKILQELADHLDPDDLRKGLPVFKNLGRTLATDTVNDRLTIQEAVDGIIFLKQAIWEKIQKAGLLKSISVEDFYKLNQAIGINIDVTCSKIAFVYHENLLKKENAMKKKLEEVARNKDEFMGAATHELRTPVTTLKGYTQVLYRQFSRRGDQKTSVSLDKMNSQIDRLNNLIGDLLDVTKIESGKLRFQLGSFNFDELVNETVDSMRLTTERHKIRLTGKMKKNIYGDRDRIGQVISNLLSNAIKYSPHATEIIVSTQKDGDNVMFSVTDFGVGIPEEDKERIFERFYRVIGGRHTTFPGLGLGLYISVGIIRRHHGDIWVESKKGKGSTFFFSLPIKNTKIREGKNTFAKEEMKHE